MTSKRDPLNTTIGDRWLSAWNPVAGVVWVQARDPKHAERLRKRADARLVVTGVSGGYLRTFEFTGKTLSWARRLIKRYTLNDSAAGAGV